MRIEIHQINDIRIAEVISENTIIRNTQDGIDLLGDLYFQGFDKIIIHEKKHYTGFFRFKNGNRR